MCALPLPPSAGSLKTPKLGWQQLDCAGLLKRKFNLLIGFDTDVKAAALGEQQWENAQGLETFWQPG